MEFVGKVFMETRDGKKTSCIITDLGLINLSPTMLDRAVYARQLSAECPHLVQLDNNFLPWVYSECDNTWYSFSGNYSKFSPEEKFKKLRRDEQEHNRAVMKAQEDVYLEYKNY